MRDSGLEDGEASPSQGKDSQNQETLPTNSPTCLFKNTWSLPCKWAGPQPESWSCIKQKARPDASSRPSCYPSSRCRCEIIPMNLTCLQFVTSVSLPQQRCGWSFCFTSHQGEVIFGIFHLK